MHEVEVFDVLTEESAHDPEIRRMAALMDALYRGGFDVWFHDKGEEPESFEGDSPIVPLIEEEGEACLPAVFVRGSLLSKGGYPTTEELGDSLGIAFVEAGGCGGGCGGGCCGGGEDEGCCGGGDDSCCGGEDDGCCCGGSCGE